MFWTGLSPDEAREALVNKDKSMRDKRMTLKEAVSQFVKDGDNVGIAGFVNVRQPVATCHEMVRQGFKDLTLSFQSAGLGPEILAGAMILDPNKFSVKRIELAYWGHEAFGLSPAWRYLAERGMLEIEDWSNYNMSARFKAGAMGLPFIPTRSPLGGDIKNCSRTKIIDCPFTERPIGLLPASNPDVAIVHVQAADKYGNCIIRGTDCTCAEIAMASAHTIVTCDAVVEVPYGAYPGACRRHYWFDGDHTRKFLACIAPMCKGGAPDALQAYYDEYIYGVENFGEFLQKIGVNQLLAVKAAEAHHCERLA
jgi:glutaconate CoA-transferase subunit A